MKSSERAGLVRPDGNHVIMAIFVELSDAGREKEKFYAGDSGVTAPPSLESLEVMIITSEERLQR